MSEGEQKSTMRRTILLCGAGLLAAVALTILWAGRRQTRADKLIQEKLAALRAAGEPVSGKDLARRFPPPPPGQDAMPFFTNAMVFADLNRPPLSSPIVNGAASLGRTEKLPAAARSGLEAYYTNAANITNLLSALPDGVHFGTHWEVGVLEAPAVPFVKVRALIQVLGTLALYAAEAGDAEAASQMLALGFRFSTALQADGTLVEHMIRHACLGLACNVAERCVNQVEFNDRQLARVLDAFPAPETNGLANTLRVESCMAIQVFSEVKAGRRLDSITGQAKEPWWKRTWNRLRSKRVEYSDADYIGYLGVTPDLQRALARPSAAEVIPEFTRRFEAYETNTTSEVGDAIYPSWTKALARHYECEAQLEAARCALRVERFRRAHGGQRPTSLQSLVPALMTSIPRDPFDNQPLRFKALTNGFVVYAIGNDGVDNGGLEKTNNPVQTNYDITVTIER